MSSALPTAIESYGRGQSLRETELDGIRLLDDLCRIGFQSDGGAEEARPVQVQPGAPAASKFADQSQIVRRKNHAAAEVMRVLKTNQRDAKTFPAELIEFSFQVADANRSVTLRGRGMVRDIAKYRRAL